MEQELVATMFGLYLTQAVKSLLVLDPFQYLDKPKINLHVIC